jgi:putative ABC transport system permease protein
MLLALLGISGVVSDGIVRRTREIGVRKALGARSRHVIAVLVRESVWAAVGGLGAGLLGVLALNAAAGMRPVYYRELLLGGSVVDWWILILTALAVLLITVLAACLWALRADRMDPAASLHAD